METFWCEFNPRCVVIAELTIIWVLGNIYIAMRRMLYTWPIDGIIKSKVFLI